MPSCEACRRGERFAADSGSLWVPSPRATQPEHRVLLLMKTVTEVDVSGVSYDTAGDGDPSMLFLHGWCCDRSFFAEQFHHFSTAHQVVAVDLPGHGESAAPSEWTIEALATEVATVARSLDLVDIVAVGHSMGAMVALALSQQSPELVSAVVMIDPPPLRQEIWKRFAAQLVPSFQGVDGAAGRRQFVEQMFLPTDDAHRRAHIVESICAVRNEVAIRMVNAMAEFDSTAALHACDVPVLTIGSAVPPNDSAFLRETNPAITIGQTVGSGHFNQLEVPEQVNPMIERFLSVTPRDGPA